MPVFKHGVSSQVQTNYANFPINRRTLAIRYPGGRGCACVPAFFLYYLHPLHNFFCNIVPKVGHCLRMVIMWVYALHHHACNPPTPHAKVCRCLCGACSLARVKRCLKVIYLKVYIFYTLHG